VLRLLEQLKTQNATFLKSLQTRVTVEPPSIYHSYFPPTLEEPVRDELGQPELSERHSMATTISDNTYEWHDAADVMSDGLEEFVMDAPEQPGQISRVSTIGSQKSSEQLDRSGDETDLDEDQLVPQDLSKHNTQTSVRRSQLPCRILDDEGSLFAVLKQNVGKVVSSSM